MREPQRLAALGPPCDDCSCGPPPLVRVHLVILVHPCLRASAGVELRVPMHRRGACCSRCSGLTRTGRRRSSRHDRRQGRTSPRGYGGQAVSSVARDQAKTRDPGRSTPFVSGLPLLCRCPIIQTQERAGRKARGGLDPLGAIRPVRKPVKGSVPAFFFCRAGVRETGRVKGETNDGCRMHEQEARRLGR